MKFVLMALVGLATLAGSVSTEGANLVTSVVMLLGVWDIRERVTRLESHLFGGSKHGVR